MNSAIKERSSIWRSVTGAAMTAAPELTLADGWLFLKIHIKKGRDQILLAKPIENTMAGLHLLLGLLDNVRNFIKD